MQHNEQNTQNTGHYQQQGAPQHPGPPGYMPPIIINNSSSASAAASAAVHGGRYGRRRQSIMTHLILFLFTAGIGNILYAWYISSWNRRRGL